jgi:hypothetical protein
MAGENSPEKSLELINAVQAELKRSKPLFQVIASMVSNESTLQQRTLTDIDDSIENLQNIAVFADSNSSRIDDEIVTATSNFCSQTIAFYEASKEVHYIHGTERGATKRQKSSSYITEEVKPALDRYKSSRTNLTRVLRNHTPR